MSKAKDIKFLFIHLLICKLNIMFHKISKMQYAPQKTVWIYDGCLGSKFYLVLDCKDKS